MLNWKNEKMGKCAHPKVLSGTQERTYANKNKAVLGVV